MLQVDDHAVAHYIDYLRAQDARRHQVEDKLTQMVDNSVTGIVAALIADDYIIILRKQVDHSSLAFITPVDANDCT